MMGTIGVVLVILGWVFIFIHLALFVSLPGYADAEDTSYLYRALRFMSVASLIVGGFLIALSLFKFE
jgi:hypothetical protein